MDRAPPDPTRRARRLSVLNQTFGIPPTEFRCAGPLRLRRNVNRNVFVNLFKVLCKVLVKVPFLQLRGEPTLYKSLGALLGCQRLPSEVIFIGAGQLLRQAIRRKRGDVINLPQGYVLVIAKALLPRGPPELNLNSELKCH
eukprot:6277741-Amphidinium_carterae.1